MVSRVDLKLEQLARRHPERGRLVYLIFLVCVLWSVWADLLPYELQRLPLMLVPVSYTAGLVYYFQPWQQWYYLPYAVMYSLLLIAPTTAFLGRNGRLVTLSQRIWMAWLAANCTASAVLIVIGNLAVWGDLYYKPVPAGVLSYSGLGEARGWVLLAALVTMTLLCAALFIASSELPRRRVLCLMMIAALVLACLNYAEWRFLWYLSWRTPQSPMLVIGLQYSGNMLGIYCGAFACVGAMGAWLASIHNPSPEELLPHCLRCGYDLRACPGPACPECGEPFVRRLDTQPSTE